MQQTKRVLITCFWLGIGLAAQTTMAQRLGCGADELREQHRLQDPVAFDAAQQQAERGYEAARMRRNTQREAAKTQNTPNTRSKYIIPTVVHVVYTNPRDSITIAQAMDMFEHLFYQSRRVPEKPFYGGAGADSYIEFAPATKDPNGNPHSGVTYTYHPTFGNSFNIGDDVALKSLIQWDPKKYCNIWLVREIRASGPYPRLAGYAQFPSTNAPATDGVVLLNGHWGRIGTARAVVSTAIHELGHWLDLLHPFQNSCDNPTRGCSASGDMVCDTPPLLAIENNIKPSAVRLNSCNVDVPDRPNNLRIYMDYVDNDQISNVNTPGQVERMQLALNNNFYERRFPLWQDFNLEATGTGQYSPRVHAFFVADRHQTCIGEPIRFMSYNRGMPDKFKWTFEGGTPETSTDEYPTVRYMNAGTYSIRLEIENAAGAKDTFVQTNYITVTNTAKTLPFREDFATSVFPPNDWVVVNPDESTQGASVTWEQLPIASPTGRGVARMAFASYSDYGQHDELITPPMDFSTTEHAALIFSRAYTPLLHRNTGGDMPSLPLLYTDTIEVHASTDCGATWTRILRRGGFDLRSTRAANSPTDNKGEEGVTRIPTEWKTDTLNLNDFAGNARVQLKFVAINGFGNNFFLDYIDVQPQNLGTSFAPVTSRPVELTHAESPLRLYPNPTTGAVRIEWVDGAQAHTNANPTLNLTDINGRLVLSQTIDNTKPETLSFDISNLPAGVYVATITTEDQQFFAKVVKL